MKLCKSAKVEPLTLSEEDLALINAHTLRELSADDVFVFKILMCDNEVDRDIERFSVDALQGFAKLFLGKTMIQDHFASASNQTARIFDTEVVQDPERKTSFGEPYTALMAKVYMARTESKADLIREIEAGIKKEVSVSCRVGRLSCSICGNETGRCKHIPGKMYDGVYCHTLLNDAKDAYEVSFVAVPAQKNAGTTKTHEDDETEKKAAEAVEADLEMLKAFIFCENEKG